VIIRTVFKQTINPLSWSSSQIRGLVYLPVFNSCSLAVKPDLVFKCNNGARGCPKGGGREPYLINNLYNIIKYIAYIIKRDLSADLHRGGSKSPVDFGKKGHTYLNSQ
jgi:hypothetical protein